VRSGTQNPAGRVDFRSGVVDVGHSGMEIELLDRFARMHLGLVTFEHAQIWGTTRHGWARAVADHTVELVQRDVARMYGTSTSPEQRILAAVLAAGSGAMASHRSSARVWGVERSELDPVDIILPDRNRRARLDRVVVHRPRDVGDLRSVMRGPVPATNPLRTLLDLGAVDASGVSGALRSFVLSGFVTPGAVGAALVRHSEKGRSGIGALREALDRWNIDAKPADSELEIQMAAIVDRFGLPPTEFHAIVGPYEVDFLVSGTRLVIECDGWTTHGADREQFELDRQRDPELAALGYIVLRMTSRALFRSPALVAKRLAHNLWTWAPDVAEAHLLTQPRSILGATRPD
jgi:hypothetical protein